MVMVETSPLIRTKSIILFYVDHTINVFTKSFPHTVKRGKSKVSYLLNYNSSKINLVEDINMEGKITVRSINQNENLKRL